MLAWLFGYTGVVGGITYSWSSGCSADSSWECLGGLGTIENFTDLKQTGLFGGYPLRIDFVVGVFQGIPKINLNEHK